MMSINKLFDQLQTASPQSGDRYWIGITGSWRTVNAAVERDVRDSVREILRRGAGILTGGALGVDWWATDEALRLDPTALLLKIFLPATLQRYLAHYRQRAAEGVITLTQAEQLIGQLTTIQKINPAAIIEQPNNLTVNQQTYFERNTAIVNASDALFAFHVNNSAGTADTIAKAVAQGKPVERFVYPL